MPNASAAPKTATRADALRNKAGLLRAAATVFAEHGFNAPLELVAQRAGVSRTTLYRNFADREALGLAIFEQQVAELETLAAGCAGRDEGLFDLLRRLTDAAVESAGWADAVVVGSAGQPRLEALRRRVMVLLSPSLARAQQAGRVRDAITPEDLHLVVRMLAGALRDAPPPDRPRTAAQALSLLLDGLTTRSSRPKS